MKSYDVVVLGAGPGGYVAAIKAAQLGAKVAIIEKETVGGICLNHGCIPTKTLLKNVKVYQSIKDAATFGVNIKGEVSIDWAKMLHRKNTVVKQLTTGVSFLLKKNKVDIYNGFGEVLNPNEIKIGDEVIKTAKLIIATGATAVVPPIKGMRESYKEGYVVTSRELLNITKIPQTMIIVGGGVIGVEFATIFASLGTKVTIIEMLPNIIATIDHDIRDAYVKSLTKLGITILTNAKVTSVVKPSVSYQKDDKTVELKAELVLVAVGTGANSKGLEKLNLKMDRANIITNEYLQTNLENVYAIGDVNGKYMLAHVASHEGLIAASHAVGVETNPMRYDRVPQAIYGSPEIASVGLTETEVKEQGFDYKVSTFPLSGSGKALADDEKDGFVKLIVDKKYNEILGAHILAYHATDIISELILALELEATADEIAQTIHPHPTLSEIIMEAAQGAVSKPIHL